MKSIPKIFLIVVILNFACQNSQKHSSENKKSVGTAISTTEYQTASGKKLLVHVDYSIGTSICKVEVETEGFDNGDTKHKLGAIDPIKEIFLADLDNNGFEEIYLITQSAGSGSYSNIYGIASNKDKSATPVYVRPISEKQLEKGGLFEGFMGHNKIYLKREKIFNSFPVYLKGDSNAKPTGGNRKIEYRLIAGEAGWILEAFQRI
jgi:hypothetical protein